MKTIIAPIYFFAAGEPKGQPRPRAFARKMGGTFVARVYDSGTAEGWKSLVAIAAKPHLPAVPLDVPVKLELDFNLPRPKAHHRSNGDLKQSAPFWHTGKPDVDNFAKAVMDALTQLGMWRDDSLVCSLTVRKIYGINPGAAVTISAL